MIHLDTHVVVWLYAGAHDRLPGGLRERLEIESLSVSPIVRLELTYLNEIGRIRHSAGQVVDELSRSMGLAVDGSGFADVVSMAEGERCAFTRDPFDRLIAAQSLVAGADLATKDETLRANLDTAVWD